MAFKQKLTSKMQAVQWNSHLRKDEYTERRLTFGKYCNRMIKDIPTDYLKWGILNLDNTWGEYFARELQKRDPEFRKMGAVRWHSML